MPTSSTPALETMRTITGVGESERSMLPATTAWAAAAPESKGRTSTSTPYFSKSPCSFATNANSPENTGGIPGTAIVSRSVGDAARETGAAAATRAAAVDQQTALAVLVMSPLLSAGLALDEPVRFLPDGAIDQTVVADRRLARLDPAEALLRLDDGVQVGLGQPLVSHRPEIELDEPRQRLLRQLRSASRDGGDLRDPVGVCRLQHVAGRIDEARQQAHVA